MKHPKGTPEERQDHVEKFMTRGIPARVMAELLGVAERTILEDMKAIKEKWIEHAAVASDAALAAHEEIAAITSAAQHLLHEMDCASNAAEKAALGKVAGHLLYLAGRLKQGKPAEEDGS